MNSKEENQMLDIEIINFWSINNEPVPFKVMPIEEIKKVNRTYN